MLSSTNIWFRFFNPNPNNLFRLFCFPYAGSGPVVYRNWYSDASVNIEVGALLLPGRESRIREAPFLHIQPLIKALLPEIKIYLDRPYAFFGHSLGALIAYELALEIQQQSIKPPIYLFLSGRRAPNLPDPFPQIHKLNDAAFTQAIQKRYNGIPKIILQDDDLLSLFLPTLKADFSILENYIYTSAPPLEIPIMALGGVDDPMATEKELAAWQDFTNCSFDLKLFPGDHFFIQQQYKSILNTISASLEHALRNC